MASLQAVLFNQYLRMTVRRQPFHEMPAQDVRDWFAARDIRVVPKGVALETVDLPGLKGEWHRPASAADRTVLYLHGGGYIFGSARMYRTLTYKLALESFAEVFSLNYRLAPEHPCPAAIEDALAAYRWLLATGRRPEQIVIGGDSAGGGLTLAVLQTLKAGGEAIPGGAFLFSPWADLGCTGASVAANARTDVTFNEAALRNTGSRYQGGIAADDPRVSPLFGDFAGLPPLLVFASKAEMFHDDAARVVEKARKAGVDVDFVARDGLAHIWPLYQAILPEAQEAVRHTADFIRNRTDSQ